MTGTARDRAIRALQDCAPERSGTTLVPLGHGADNQVFLAGDIVLRVTRHRRQVSDEAHLLRTIAPRLSLPVPVPELADDITGVLAYPLLPGRPLLGKAAPPGAATRLGTFLRELHDTDAGSVTDLIPTPDTDPGQWLNDLSGPAQLLRVVHTSVPYPTECRVVTHGDLGAEHILAADGTLTGIIDWSDAAITDPALDFARLYRDFGPEFLADALDAYGGLDGAALPRIEFLARCAALEDLRYGMSSGRGEYAESALRSFRWLFPSWK